MSRLITLAIHTLPYARRLKKQLEAEGIAVTLQNVNLDSPEVSAGVRVRIDVDALPRALRMVENPDIFSDPEVEAPDRRVVILPVDFSDYSTRALLPAFGLAAMLGTRVILLHAHAPANILTQQTLTDSLTFDEELIDDPELDADVEMAARRTMKRFARRVKAEMLAGTLPAAPFETRVAEGLPEEVIAETARTIKGAVIVMGTRGAHRRERQIVGSVTAEVLDTVRCPVLSIPENIPVSDPSKVSRAIFFATPDQLDIVAFDTFTRLIPSADMHVTLVALPSRRHDEKNCRTQLKRLADYCREHYPNLQLEERILSNEDVRTALRHTGMLDGLQLLCVPSRRRNALARFFNPTLAHRILFHADIPMLSIPV